MIKAAILTQLAKKRLNSKKSGIDSGNEKAYRIGLIVNQNDMSMEHIQLINQEICEQGKVCHLIIFTNQNSTQPIDDFAYFTPKDIGVLGEIKSADLNHFLQKEYDFIVTTDKSDNPFINFVISKANTNYRIGYRTQKHDFMDLQVDAVNSEMEWKELIKYLKMIDKGGR